LLIQARSNRNKINAKKNLSFYVLQIFEIENLVPDYLNIVLICASHSLAILTDGLLAVSI
jgi:hypothetical protein